jgi:antitoxin PrlF
MKSRVSSKGQITIPAAVRERLGLRPGTVVSFEVRREGALLRKGGGARHPVDAIYGTLRLDRSVDELIDEMRGPRPHTRRSVRKK